MLPFARRGRLLPPRRSLFAFSFAGVSLATLPPWLARLALSARTRMLSNEGEDALCVARPGTRAPHRGARAMRFAKTKKPATSDCVQCPRVVLLPACPCCCTAAAAVASRHGAPLERASSARARLEAVLAARGGRALPGREALAAQCEALRERRLCAGSRAAVARAEAARRQVAARERDAELGAALAALREARSAAAEQARTEALRRVKEELAEAERGVAARRRQLLAQLQAALPLTAAREDHGRGGAEMRKQSALVAPVVVRLCGARLPDGPRALAALPAEELAAALGEAVRHTELLAAYVGAPLLHEGAFRASRSAVWQRDTHWRQAPMDDRPEILLRQPAEGAQGGGEAAAAAGLGEGGAAGGGGHQAPVSQEASEALKALTVGAHLLARSVGSACSLALWEAGVAPPEPPGWFPFVAAAALCSAWAAGEEPRPAATNAASAARVGAARSVAAAPDDRHAGVATHAHAYDAAFGADSPESSAALSSWAAESPRKTAGGARRFEPGPPGGDEWSFVDRPEMPPPPSRCAVQISRCLAASRPLRCYTRAPSERLSADPRACAAALRARSSSSTPSMSPARPPQAAPRRCQRRRRRCRCADAPRSRRGRRSCGGAPVWRRRRLARPCGAARWR